MLLRSPLLLDENANLGTVMRYEEIGEWGRESWGIGSHLPPPPGQSGGRERLENPGSSLLLSVLPAEFQARTKVSGVPLHTSQLHSLQFPGVGLGTLALFPLAKALIQKTWKLSLSARQTDPSSAHNAALEAAALWVMRSRGGPESRLHVLPEAWG